MNVYVRELASSLAQAGVGVTVYVRRWAHQLPREVAVEPGFRVVHVEAGPVDLPKEQLPETVDAFTEGLVGELRDRPVDVVHANYWLSGVVGHRVKHRLDLPLVSTFHTLARVKAETGDPEPDRRIDAEAEVIGCSDVLLANSVEEHSQLQRLYGADPSRIEIVPPGVEHAFFSPGHKAGARQALGLSPSAPLLLFVGRIQPLKGLTVAVGALAELVAGGHPDAELVVVGGPSGADGADEARAVRALAVHARGGRSHPLGGAPAPPPPVELVPRRRRGAGAQPVRVVRPGGPGGGGVRHPGGGGRGRRAAHPGRPRPHGPAGGASGPAGVRRRAAARILSDPALAASLSVAAAERARGYTWSTAAARLRRIYVDLATRSRVDCAA